MDDNLAPPVLRLKPREAARRVLSWWDVHRRDPPWRAAPGERPDPYRVWLSEILLQQTTATAAAPYFERFVARWPRVEALAAASLDEVMAAFSGLGYYSRARNLHACAQEVARRGGRFPHGEAELRALPGVGAYTAAAVAAIAFGAKATPVDGNVARILARLCALEAPIAQGRRALRAAAAALTPAKRCGDFAEALMDLGALICRATPIAPLVRCAGLARRRRRARPRPIRAAPPPSASRPASARRSSPGARTARSWRGGARPEGCWAERSSCRDALGRRPSARTSAAARRLSRRPGGACRARSSRPSPISR
jgi:A/G-specific adenine glycosylase